jgi:hypothetical protein
LQIRHGKRLLDHTLPRVRHPPPLLNLPRERGVAVNLNAKRASFIFNAALDGGGLADGDGGPRLQVGGVVEEGDAEGGGVGEVDAAVLGAGGRGGGASWRGGR